MADAAGRKPLSSEDYHSVLTGTQPNTSVGPDLGEPVDVDDFYSPAGTVSDVPNGAATSITTNEGNDTDPTRVLFNTSSNVNNEATPKVTVPAEVNKSPEKPMNRPELFKSPQAKKIASNMKRYESRFEEGYDSDGSIGPFYDAVAEEGEQDYDDDDEIPEGALEETAASAKDPPQNVSENVSDKTPAQSADATIVNLTEAKIALLNREQLKVECRQRGQTVGGNKSQLQERLREALKNGVAVKTDGALTSTTTGNKNAEPKRRRRDPNRPWKSKVIKLVLIGRSRNQQRNLLRNPTIQHIFMLRQFLETKRMSF
jgi:hypothetical protein